MAIVCWNLIGRKPNKSAMLKRELDRGINSKLQQRVKSLEQKINNIKMSIHHIKIDNEHVSDQMPLRNVLLRKPLFREVLGPSPSTISGNESKNIACA